jgi:hypothetical protein
MLPVRKPLAVALKVASRFGIGFQRENVVALSVNGLMSNPVPGSHSIHRDAGFPRRSTSAVPESQRFH